MATLRSVQEGVLRHMPVVLVMLSVVSSDVMDIQHDHSRIVRHHNNERRHRNLRAANMLEMRWDDNLAREAGRWAENCRYARPPKRDFYDVGSNLYYERNAAYTPAALKDVVNSALRSWSMGKQEYVYSRECGRACSYVQMITARSDRIGCAVSNCYQMQVGYNTEYNAALFVCFYSPSVDVYNSFPYQRGSPCSNCPRDTYCSNDICSAYGNAPVSEPDRRASYDYDWNYQTGPQELTEIETGRPADTAATIERDALMRDEVSSLERAHNRMREAENRTPLVWDPYLERWAKHVIRCDVDYPGPRYVYTNFHRLYQNDNLYDVVAEWAKEGRNTNLRFAHGCRTPNDLTRCNHFTNLNLASNSAMACATKKCPRNSRQLVCLYDNFNGRTSARAEYFAPRPISRPLPYRRRDEYNDTADDYRRRQEDEQRRRREQENLRRRRQRERERRRRRHNRRSSDTKVENSDKTPDNVYYL